MRPAIVMPESLSLSPRERYRVDPRERRMLRELHSRIVQVAAGPKGGDWDCVATGFALSASRILTCAHGTRPGGRHQVRFLEIDRETWIDAEVLWNGESAETPEHERLDVAVLEVNPAKVRDMLEKALQQDLAPALPPIVTEMLDQLSKRGSRLPSVLSLRAPRPKEEHWQSRGALKAAQVHGDDGHVLAEVEDFGGTFHDPNLRNLMTLVVDAPPKVADGWQGGSGSPVFVDRELLGVVSAWPTEWDGKTLKAAWLGGLQENERFLEAVGLSGISKDLVALGRRIADALLGEELERLRRLLGKQLSLEAPTPERISLRFRSLSPVRIVVLANALFDELIDTQATQHDSADLDSAQALVDAVDLALTAALDVGSVDSLSRLDREKVPASARQGAATGFQLMSLPCLTRSVAELFMARLDQRAASHSLEPELADDPPGVLWVPFAPQSGFRESKLDMLLEHLANACHLPPMLRKGASNEVLARRINTALGALCDPEKMREPRRWYLLCLDDSARDDAVKLKALVPELRACQLGAQMTDAAESEEIELCTLLWEYLERKRALRVAQERRKHGSRDA